MHSQKWTNRKTFQKRRYIFYIHRFNRNSFYSIIATRKSSIFDCQQKGDVQLLKSLSEKCRRILYT